MSWVAQDEATTLIAKLSARQRDVLQLVSRGLTNYEIGVALGISSETVRTHVQALIGRLGVSNRVEAAAIHMAYDTGHSDGVPGGPRPAIGVLPVLPPGPDEAGVRLAAALTRGLVSLFSRWCCFPVIVNASAQAARRCGGTSQEIGAALGARFLVDAWLDSVSSGLRITTCVTDSSNGHCVWTDSCDLARPLHAQLPEWLCPVVVAAAYPQLIATVQAGLPRGCKAEALDAWRLALRSLADQAAPSPEANARAQAGCDLAILREPTLVLAHFGLGLACYDAIVQGWGALQPAREKLAACAERCIALAPHQAEGYFLLGRYCQVLGRPEAAIAPLAQAVCCNPSFAAAQALLGQVLLSTGHSDTGLLHMQHACRLDPRSFLASLAAIYLGRAEYDAALSAAEQVLAYAPRHPWARALATAAAWWKQEPARAAAHYHLLLAAQPALCLDSFRGAFPDQTEARCRTVQALAQLAVHTSSTGPQGALATAGPAADA